MAEAEQLRKDIIQAKKDEGQSLSTYWFISYLSLGSFFLRKLFFQRCLAITINFGGVGMGNGIYIRRFCNYFVFNKYFTSLKCQEIVPARFLH